MNQRNLLGFGCVSLTQHPFLKQAHNILESAFDEGITHFDTAPLYSNGYSEKILGKFINNKRNKITITTKCGLGTLHQPNLNLNIALILNTIKNKIKRKRPNNVITEPHPNEYREINVEYVNRSLSNSLNNLKTDYIDYYLLHEALPSFLTEEAYVFLKEQQSKGIIRELGIGAGYINLTTLLEHDVKFFNVLQYENGPNFNSDFLLKKFIDQKHFYHSSLKFIPYLNKKYSYADWAGIILNRSCKFNPSGKFLFSTTQIKRLKSNLAAFDKYNTASLNELNSIINGLY